jgi:hypothetical protein
MNRVFGLFLATGALLAGCSPPSKEKAAEAPLEKRAESRVQRGTNGEVILKLDAATQKLMGVQTAPVASTQWNPQVKAFGRVLDVSPLAGVVAELTAAKAASDASQSELARLKTLAAQTNASQRALEAGEAASARDQAQAESARLRLLANWGGAIAGRADLAAFVRSLGAMESALVELDLPAGEAVKTTPTGARLLTLAEGAAPLEAQFIGPAPTVDAQAQGQGFLFLVQPNAARLAPGAALSGFLSMPGEAQSGVLAPRNAVLRYNGSAWVYVQTGDETFRRIEVALDRPLDGGWFVREGLKAQDKVVTVGAQQMLSEELKGLGGGE